MPLYKVGEVEKGDLVLTIYKGSFLNICNMRGEVLFGLLHNESLVVDEFHVMQVVSDEIANDLINGRLPKRSAKLRGF